MHSVPRRLDTRTADLQPGPMTVIPLPRHGQWAWDSRGEGRGVRVSAHADVGVLNVSLWREGTCVGTAQLLPADVAKLVSGLSEGLAEIAAQPPVHEGAAPERLQELEQRLAEVESRLGSPDRQSAAERAKGVTRTALAGYRRGIAAFSGTVFGDRARSTADRRDPGPHGG
jgi:hypothetical protein